MHSTARKLKEHPVVPVGMLAATGYLIAAVHSTLLKNDKAHGVQMMKGRVAAQGATLVAISAGMLWKVIPPVISSLRSSRRLLVYRQ